MGDKIEALGVPVLAVDMQPGRFSISGYRRLVHILREHRSDVVQTWMYHANLIGGLAARQAEVPRIVWGLHHTTLDPRRDKRHTIWAARLGGFLSGRVPDRVICCSQATCDTHCQIGYRADRMIVIPNGYDLATFKPDHGARARLHEELGLDQSVKVIGMAARFHPQKDHENFLDAAAITMKSREDIQFLLCGGEIDMGNATLMAWISERGLEGRVHLLGVRHDMPSVYAGLDVATLSSSHGEAFPNVVSESMSCGIPTIVTDVGDAVHIVGDAGWVVSPSDSEALAGAWLEALALSPEEREKLGLKTRTRIRERFSIQSMVARYEEQYLLDR